MSSQLHFSLTYHICRDTPDALKNAFSALADRQLPEETDLAQLPPIVAEHLKNPHPPEGLDGDGFTYRFSRTTDAFREGKPSDGTHWIHFEYTIPTDAYGNGSMYVIFWLFQFAAYDAHLATEIMDGVCLPTIYTKDGDDILITYLKSSNDTEHPVIVDKTYRQNLAELLENIKEMVRDV